MRWNPVEGGARFQRIDDHRLATLRRRLDGAGIPTSVRDTQGRDVDAACGQRRLRATEVVNPS